MNRKKNILLIIPNLGHGGAQKSICQLSIELSQYHHVHLIVFDYKQSDLVYPYMANLIGLNLGKAKNIISKWTFFKKRIKEIKRFKKENNIDYSISFLEGANFVNVLSNVNEKMIVSVRGSKRFDQNITGIQGFLRKKIIIPRILKKADKVVAIGKGIKNELITDFSLPETKVDVISPSFDIDEIDGKLTENIEQKHQKLFSEATIVYHGRLALEKGQDKLLEVFNAWHKFESKTKLILIGEGAFKTELMTQCEILGLSYTDWKQSDDINSTVHFLPFTSNVFPYLKAADLFISCSRHEGFGRSILDALYSGVRILANDCPYGPRDILEHSTLSNEYLIDSNSSSEVWVKRIDMALNDRNDKFIKEGRKIAMQYEASLVSQQWLQIIV